ncbi:N-acetylmuramoyl-L-alanine amidase-like domain-containing protein [Pleomorphovibrio marinus]|uniref:N-acetylmuramoyl-L-alanine amidase-like domain-containing protein n=1 Tax=Pleomorphovibrio marinus TaxID=2164132 RepID=UPI000E0BB023|nr:N-acetylmuramoyl-L-alanine amidase-like domain-containing protein [Pleomorphovibrio marinus]
MKIFVYFLMLFPLMANAQTVCTLESRERLEQVLAELSQGDLDKLTLNQLNVKIGNWFLGTPYVEKTLELPGEERLVVNLTGLDCTTYLETVVTLSRLVIKGNLDGEAYEKELEFLRYRGGANMDYPSRLHYFSDWIYENQEKGILRDITAEIGGQVYENKPTFMSTHPKFYPQLSRGQFVDQIKAAEKAIASRTYHYIPKDQIQKLEHLIQPGDLIGITASMNNLDMVHVGFAVKKGGRIHLMHASTGSMEVEVSQKPLSDYLKGFKSQSGIMVSRLVRE